MADLELARYCIEVMKEIGIYRGHKIGKLKEDFTGPFPRSKEQYKKGRIVLYYKDGEDTCVIQIPRPEENIRDILNLYRKKKRMGEEIDMHSMTGEFDMIYSQLSRVNKKKIKEIR